MQKNTLDEVYRCIHCGICLSECPTYRITGLETESPRGRIHLARALAEGRLEANERFAEHMYLCLGCRACESVCPSGVRFGEILEASRDVVGAPGKGVWGSALRFFLEHILPYPRRLRTAFSALGFYRRSPLARLIGAIMPGRLRGLEALLPEVPSRFFTSAPHTYPPIGRRTCRVGFLSGCIMSILYADVNEATIRVLRRSGCEVVVSGGQACCGALHVHNGGVDMARRLARKNIDAFLAEDVDAVVVNSAGCGSAMKEYQRLLEDDPAYAERARLFSKKVTDISEFLVGLGKIDGFGRLDLRVTYQDPCHLVHAQRISEQPRALLRSIPGVTLVEMKDSTRCCGSAGIYNVIHPEMSEAMLREKLGNILETGAEVVVAPNPGCMIQIESGIRSLGSNVRTAHIVELLDIALEAEKKEA
ncbi:MAG: (Fe-S)-binding protein [Candidatus Methanosuratincola sp.]|jgi:glycolate oxidase iron-sulfur subunit